MVQLVIDTSVSAELPVLLTADRVRHSILEFACRLHKCCPVVLVMTKPGHACPQGLTPLAKSLVPPCPPSRCHSSAAAAFMRRV